MQIWTGAGGLARLRSKPEAHANIYRRYVDDARRAEDMGFDGYGAAEHHFMYDGFCPMPLQALCAAAAVTSRIKLVTAAMILPLYEPLEAGEAAATADQLSGGRVVLGLGMGYRPLEFAGLATEKKTRAERLVEGIECLNLMTSQETFSYAGKHYRYDDARLPIRPAQQPIPAWYCGGTSNAAARRSGTAGLPYWLASSSLERTEEMVEQYRTFGAQAGHPAERLRVAAFKDVCLGDTIEEARAARALMLDSFYEEHILGYGYLVDDRGQHVYNPPKGDPMYVRFVDSIFAGTPEMLVEELERYQGLGMEAVYLATFQPEIVAERVLPALRAGVAA